MDNELLCMNCKFEYWCNWNSVDDNNYCPNFINAERDVDEDTSILR